MGGRRVQEEVAAPMERRRETIRRVAPNERTLQRPMQEPLGCCKGFDLELSTVEAPLPLRDQAEV